MTFPYNANIARHHQPILQAGFLSNHAVDAGNRSRVSVPLTLFEHNNQTGTNIFKWDTLTAGTGTVTDGSGSTMGATTLSTGGTVNGAQSIRASRFYIHQAAGKNIWAGQSFSFGPSVVNVVKRCGYFDANNGAFMEQDGTNGGIINLSVRNNGVDTKFPQGTWLGDNMDGTGPSEKVFNPSAGDIDLRIEMFGGAMIRFYLYVDNQFILIHTVFNTMATTNIGAQTANLTLRGEVTNVGTAGATATLKMLGSNVFIEGTEEQIPAFIGAASNGITLQTVTTRRPILSVRAGTLAINGIDRNYGQIVPQSLSIFTDGNIFLEAVYNATLTGAAFSSVGPTSVAQFDVAATALAGGISALNSYVVATGSGANAIGAITIGGQNVFEQFPIVYSSLKNTQDTITIVATSLSATAHVGAALNWTEIY